MFEIVVDTREQRPYKFQVPTVTKKLDVGDYSFVGGEEIAVIERKTLDDAYGTFFSDNRTRFYAELDRAKKLNRFVILIEARPKIFCDPMLIGRRISENAVRGTVAEWEAEYPNLEFVFVDSREKAIGFCAWWLRAQYDKWESGMFKKRVILPPFGWTEFKRYRRTKYKEVK